MYADNRVPDADHLDPNILVPHRNPEPELEWNVFGMFRSKKFYKDLGFCLPPKWLASNGSENSEKFHSPLSPEHKPGTNFCIGWIIFRKLRGFL